MTHTVLPSGTCSGARDSRDGAETAWDAGKSERIVAWRAGFQAGIRRKAWLGEAEAPIPRCEPAKSMNRILQGLSRPGEATRNTEPGASHTTLRSRNIRSLRACAGASSCLASPIFCRVLPLKPSQAGKGKHGKRNDLQIEMSSAHGKMIFDVQLGQLHQPAGCGSAATHVKDRRGQAKPICRRSSSGRVASQMIQSEKAW